MKKSAGILLFQQMKVFLVHPGGPFWKNKDDGAWSIPKGEFGEDEEPFDAAKREFEEETGIACDGEFIDLGSLKLKTGKIIYAWALEKYVDPETVKSNNFSLEWPIKSGRFNEYPEVDKAHWFTFAEARKKINGFQVLFIDRLEKII